MSIPYHERVAIVTTSYPSHESDWAGHFVREEARELVRANRAVTVMTTRTAICDEGVRVVECGGGSAFGPPGALARIAAFPPRAVSAAMWMRRVSTALRRERFDRVIAHWAVPSALAARSSGALEVVSHGSDVRVLASLPPRVRAVLVAAITENACAWRFVSEPLRDAMLGALDGELAARVSAIATVKAPSIFVPDVRARANAIRAELGAFHVCVGRLVASKRVDKAIDRAATHGELLVVVGDGPERASLERRVARVSARVRFTGDLPRPEALAYMAAARTLVFASESEGCPTILREARALDTPVAHI